MEVQKNSLSFVDAMILCGVLIFSAFIGMRLIPVAFENPVLNAVSKFLIFAIVILGVIKLRNLDAVYFFPRKRYDGALWPFMVVTLSLLLIHRVFTDAIDLYSTNEAEFITRRGTSLYEFHSGAIKKSLSVLIVGPIMEELMFRGVILSSFRMRYGINKSIFLSAVLFATLHVSINIYFITTFGFSFLIASFLAWVVLKTGNIKIAVACHFSWNFTAYIVIPLVFVALPVRIDTSVKVMIALFAMLILSVTLLYVGQKRLKNDLREVSEDGVRTKI